MTKRVRSEEKFISSHCGQTPISLMTIGDLWPLLTDDLHWTDLVSMSKTCRQLRYFVRRPDDIKKSLLAKMAMVKFGHTAPGLDVSVYVEACKYLYHLQTWVKDTLVRHKDWKVDNSGHIVVSKGRLSKKLPISESLFKQMDGDVVKIRTKKGYVLNDVIARLLLKHGSLEKAFEQKAKFKALGLKSRDTKVKNFEKDLEELNASLDAIGLNNLDAFSNARRYREDFWFHQEQGQVVWRVLNWLKAGEFGSWRMCGSNNPLYVLKRFFRGFLIFGDFDGLCKNDRWMDTFSDTLRCIEILNVELELRGLKSWHELTQLDISWSDPHHFYVEFHFLIHTLFHCEQFNRERVKKFADEVVKLNHPKSFK